MIVVDTSILVDHLRRSERTRDVLSAAVNVGELLAISVLTEVEVLAGVRPHEVQATMILLGSFHPIPVTQDIARAAGIMANTYVKTHPGIDAVDYVIAATTQMFGAQLWTRNVKHFPMFGELRPPY